MLANGNGHRLANVGLLHELVGVFQAGQDIRIGHLWLIAHEYALREILEITRRVAVAARITRIVYTLFRRYRVVTLGEVGHFVEGLRTQRSKA